MSTEYTVIHRVPTLEEYIRLCTAVGWKEFMNFEVAEKSLRQSIFGVVVERNGEVIGMGRIVGDGQIYFYIQDVAVDPDHQGQGVGRWMMGALMNYLKENAPEKAFVGLFASQGKEAFYRRFGLNDHEGMTGMFGVVIERKIG
ncbi:GNAT family N-acetyltransferase [uncultured Paenibacillus sp.]|uniref:GNAT family N-acetyltransferase n=1 Tax=uncultured Paenibacillus sp. TaxID=227322 RepID=UPI0028042C78|nr:GNAT family N-acetyltransferase [uncultured Paenibacillus sp.]